MFGYTRFLGVLLVPLPAVFFALMAASTAFNCSSNFCLSSDLSPPPVDDSDDGTSEL